MKLNRLFATQADLARNLSPELILEILSNQMRELRDLVPEEFLREVSALLQAARDVVLRNGLELAMAAEQSLGIEHGTAFDVIRDRYLASLPPAAQTAGRHRSVACSPARRCCATSEGSSNSALIFSYTFTVPTLFAATALDAIR